MGKVKDFILHNYRHFNAAALVDAAKGWEAHLAGGGKMVLTMAGAMSTAELGLSVAELIRQEKVHALCLTGANLEEDLFNLVAHDHYRRIPHFRELSAKDEKALLEQHLNRVTDTCIPEQEAMRLIERHILALWMRADKENERYFPHEYFYQLIKSRILESTYQIDPKNSWLVAAAEQNLPMWVPGWEDSTLGNMLVANVLRKNVSRFDIIKSGVEQMASLVDWYTQNDRTHQIGFFQIGGGIAGDFPICVVPLIQQDMETAVRPWSYFCQISDATTSYGSYSGAPPTEKITWGKIDIDTPRYVIESDATIVFPLIAAYLLDT